MIEVLVCCNDRDRYTAWIDPEDQREGFVKPWFDLETVHRLAEDTQEAAGEHRHGSYDTVHVIEGVVEGKKHAVVILIVWMYLDGEKREKAVQIIEPNAEGRYPVGGHDWNWYGLDDFLSPLIPFPRREEYPQVPGQRTA